MFLSVILKWFPTKLYFINELGGPIIDKTDISVAADLIGELSKSEKLSAKNVSPFSDSVLSVGTDPGPVVEVPRTTKRGRQVKPRRRLDEED